MARSGCSTQRLRQPGAQLRSTPRMSAATRRSLELTTGKDGIPSATKPSRKRLQLGPNDDTANALAGIRALSKHQFVEAYHLFRKAYFLNPKETWRVYFVSEILFRAEMSDLAEKWLQRALDQETSPQLHHLMECYRLMWRRRFAGARAGFSRVTL